MGWAPSQCSRSSARVASASASSATSAASGPSTITRSAGSVPDGRTRIRPALRAARWRPAMARWRTGSALPLVLVTHPHGPLLLGQERDRLGELGQRPRPRRHHPQDLEGGDDPVARGRVLADDDVAALLAAQAGARRPACPRGCTCRRPACGSTLPAGRLDGRLEPAVREDRHDERPAGAARRARAGRGPGCPRTWSPSTTRPDASTAISRSASPSSAKPDVGAPLGHEPRPGAAGSVAPQSDVDVDPVRARRG